jgi:hypothetical protein
VSLPGGRSGGPTSAFRKATAGPQATETHGVSRAPRPHFIVGLRAFYVQTVAGGVRLLRGSSRQNYGHGITGAMGGVGSGSR